MFRLRWGSAHVQLAAVLVLGAILLLNDLGGPSLSVDEFVNLQIERGSWGEILVALHGGQDLHPPLTHFLMSLWLRLAGENEWTARLPWALIGLFNLWLVHRLGVVLQGERLGLLASFLTATAPTFVLYTRFEKYYSLTITLSLALILTGLALWWHPQRRTALAYGCILFLLLYTDYLAPLFLVLGQNLLLVLLGWEARRVRMFIVAQIGGLVFYLPWLGVLLSQAYTLQHMGEADLGASWSGLALKLAYLFYSLGVGETLFPWRVAAVLGLIASLVVLAFGLWALRRWEIASICIPTLPFLVIFPLLAAVGAALFTSFRFTAVPFIAFPNHILFVLPFFSLIIAAGILALPHKAWVILLMSLLILTRAVSLYNYFTGQEYHNPIYAVPMRQVASQVVAEWQPGDVILSDPDSGFQYYYDRGPQPVPALPSTPTDASIAYLKLHSPRRVWLLTFGRDRTREAKPMELVCWLEENYHLTLEQGYVEQDPTYRRIKELLVNRPSYRYKLLVQRYERPTP